MAIGNINAGGSKWRWESNAQGVYSVYRWRPAQSQWVHVAEFRYNRGQDAIEFEITKTRPGLPDALCIALLSAAQSAATAPQPSDTTAPV